MRKKPVHLKVGIGGFGGSIAPPITETHPDKMKFWSHRNGYSPSTVTYGVGDVAQWQCPENPDHSWEMSISVFCRRQLNCPFCAVRPVREERQLALRMPELVSEWDPENNGPLSPKTVAWNARRSIAWICRKNKRHRWRSSVHARSVHAEGCPFCESASVAFKDSLSKNSRQLVSWWNSDSEINAGLTPRTIRADSTVVVSWRCPIGHTDLLSVQTRITLGETCRVCARTSTGRNLESLASQYPALADEWHPVRNKKLGPEEVPAGSIMRAWWLCSRCGNSWRSPICQRTASDSGCPYCSGASLSKEASLAGLYPEIGKQWHRKKNGSLKASQVFPCADLKVWWQCKAADDHEWEANLTDRVNKLTGCPFCAGQRVCTSNSLPTVFPELASQWHPTLNDTKDPSIVYAYSTKSAWWRCSLFPEHEWQVAPSSRARNNSGCPHCLWVCTDAANSFVARHPELLKEWNEERNNPVKPEQMQAMSSKKVWWKCISNPAHEWQAQISNRAGNKSGCPFCAGKKVDVHNCLQSTHPELALEWDFKKNAPLRSCTKLTRSIRCKI